MDRLTNIRDLMLPEDALDMEVRYTRVQMDHDRETEQLFAENRHMIGHVPFDWDLDLPPEFWF